MSDTIQQLKQQYDFDQVFDLNNLSSPSSLSKFLKTQYKAVYQPNNRIVFSHYGDIPILLLEYLQKVVFRIDISNFFILILTDDLDIVNKLTQVSNKWTTDSVPIQSILIKFDKPVVSTYNLNHFVIPESICMAPWARLDVTPSGEFRPCSIYNGTVVNLESGVPYNNRENTINEVYFSPELTALRQDFLNNKCPKKCEGCWVRERAGLKSIRQHIQWELNSAEFDIDWFYETKDNIKSLALALGNVCNLRCRTCNPEASSSWAAEKIQQLPKSEKRSSPLYNKLKNKSWVYKKLNFWEDIQDIIPELIELRFTGGEPMLIPKQFKLVKDIADSGHASHIDLNYTTNGTVFPEDAINDWKKFKSVVINLSIDDIGPRFEYLRYGAEWQVVEDHFKKYIQLSNNTFTVMINCTVSILNIFYLDQICKWFDNHGIDHVNLTCYVEYPSELSITNMTPQAKAAVIDKLSTSDFPYRFKDQIEGLIKIINMPSANSPEKFNQYILTTDLIRKQKLSNSHQEIAQLMNYKD
jgi:molybdenum cofactor biosynthesis enzyme MoaA